MFRLCNNPVSWQIWKDEYDFTQPSVVQVLCSAISLFLSPSVSTSLSLSFSLSPSYYLSPSTPPPLPQSRFSLSLWIPSSESQFCQFSLRSFLFSDNPTETHVRVNHFPVILPEKNRKWQVYQIKVKDVQKERRAAELKEVSHFLYSFTQS